ncbi:hypothetical protein GF406_19460 [candidate division KSB1 bacterium]|nr:hypothetical protein [candidate division KSB1 bacterium]
MKRLFLVLSSVAILVGGSHAQLVVKNTGGTEVMTVSNAGDVMMKSLEGTGIRMVVADANGNLSTQTIPSGGGNDGVVTGASVAGTSTKTVTLTRSNSLANVSFSFTDAVNDADHSTSNEIQTLSKSGSTVSLSRGGGSFTDAVNDADHDPNNELQNLQQVLDRGRTAYPDPLTGFAAVGFNGQRQRQSGDPQYPNAIVWSYKPQGSAEATGALGSIGADNRLAAVYGREKNPSNSSYAGLFVGRVALIDGDTGGALYISTNHQEANTQMYSCGYPATGFVVVAKTSSAALNNCRIIDSSVSRVNAIPIHLYYP